MNAFRSVLFLALLLALAPWALAQQPPHVAYLYPAGGQTGTTFEALIGGQHLEGVSNVYFSGVGIQAVVLEHDLMPTPKEFAELRDRRKMLVQQDHKTPELKSELAAIDKKLSLMEKRRSNPALAETVPIRVTIAADAPSGNCDLRVTGFGGLSNPRVFQIGEQPEFRKPESDVELAALTPLRRERGLMGILPPGPPMTIALPVTVNGWIPPGGVDQYRFFARAGQKLVICTSARELIPYLADAVPGWFQAAVTLYDAQGRELAYDDHYRFRPDPVLCCTIPSNGEYAVEIRDSLYRGRDDFVYRITMGELPFVTSIFPLGGRAGSPTPVAIRGWNLGVDHDTVQFAEPGLFSVVTRKAGHTSNRVPFAVDTLPECFEQEPNDASTSANRVTLPVIVNGRIDTSGDVDVFQFEGHTGDTIVAEAYARRLDSPLDSVLRLSDACGRQLAFNDDHEDKSMGLQTHHADSYLSVTLPADGAYFVQLWDAQHKGGAAYGYRLHLRALRPDFELRVVPSSISGRSGANVPLTVYALRRDGFAGEIALSLQDPPAGFKLSSARVVTNQDQAKFTLSLSQDFSDEPVELHLVGRATIAGHEVVHPAVPAEDMMQAFAYRHLVPARDLEAMVLQRMNPFDLAKLLSATPIKIPAGGTAAVHVRIPTGPRIDKIDFELSDAPEGITLQGSSTMPDATEFILQSDDGKVLPGQKGNLIIKVFGTRMAAVSDKPEFAGKMRRLPLGALPAIPFEIVPR